MRLAGEALRAAGVSSILVVHGTFAGLDALGLASALGRLIPAAPRALGWLSKKIVDSLMGENGNYTPKYVKLFEKALAGGGTVQIPVRRFNWSGENHHLGRADAAVRLLHALHALGGNEAKRVILWGHSHAGNVFALLTNLLGSGAAEREAFFEAARVYYARPTLGGSHTEVWEDVRKLLARESQPLGRLQVDIANFGTPVRYGWDPAGYGHLLHFVHHRQGEGTPAHRAHFPQHVDDVLEAQHGDYVQHAGIAGTNFAPPILAWRAWLADRRLHALLQPEYSTRDLLDRLQQGMRVAHGGETLLVNYPQQPETIFTHLAGHAIYTRREWMLYHLEEIAKRWYGKA